MNAPADIKAYTGGQNKPFGAVERMIAMRYLRAKKTQGGVGLIAAISFTCIALAIWAMIVIMSIMNGFRDDMIRLTIGSEGHMYVASSSPQPTPESMTQLEERLGKIQGVDEAFQFSANQAGIAANSQFSGAQVIGISPENLRDFEMVADSIQYGSLDFFGQGRGSEHQVAIGIRMASGLGLNVGDRFTIFSSRMRSTAFGPPQPVTKVYTVGAIFEIGLLIPDQSYIYMDFNQANQLFKGGQISGEIQLRLNNPDEIDKIEEAINIVAKEPVFIQTWRDRNESIATALRTEQVAMRFIFMIVVIIAAFPVLASMIMLVKNKSKDIAILRTIGATQGGILRIFFMSGAMIGILGTLIGLIVGILFCVNISTVQAIIEFIIRRELFPSDVYQLSGGIPAKIVWTEVFGVAFWGFVISAAATFFPAWTASKIDPVDALRYE